MAVPGSAKIERYRSPDWEFSINLCTKTVVFVALSGRLFVDRYDGKYVFLHRNGFVKSVDVRVEDAWEVGCGQGWRRCEKRAQGTRGCAVEAKLGKQMRMQRENKGDQQSRRGCEKRLMRMIMEVAEGERGCSEDDGIREVRRLLFDGCV